MAYFKDRLTDRQAMFCNEYMIDLNATQAAVRAGYSKPSASSIGHENLRKVLVVDEIARLKKIRMDETRIDAAYVLKMSNVLLQRCMAEDDDLFNAAGAGKALDLIGKHIDVQAFNEKSTSETVVKVKSFTDMYE